MPTVAKKRKKKNPSRADRRDEACEMLRATQQTCEELQDDIDKLTVDSTMETLEAVYQRIVNLDHADAESIFEELKEEIESWRDGMPENMQGGDKYSQLEDCANQLDTAISALQSATQPEITIEGDKVTATNAHAVLLELKGAKEAIEEYADELGSAADEADSADFPGMFG